MWTFLIIGIVLFYVVFMLFVWSMCRIAADADKHINEMMENLAKPTWVSGMPVDIKKEEEVENEVEK